MKLREPLTEEEADHLTELKAQLLNAPPRVLRLMRRQIRYRLFRIKEGREEFDKGLGKYFQARLEGRQTLNDFTFTWDVAPNDPLKVVSPFEWEANGGTYELFRELCDDGIVREVRVCRPAAFTKQE